MGLSDSLQGHPSVMSSRRALVAFATTLQGLPGSSTDLSTRAVPNHPRRVHLPVASSPAFTGFILRGRLAAFDLLTRPNRVHLRYGSRAHLPSSRQFHYWNPRSFGYMQNRQLHGELLSVHKISQAFPGVPRVSKRSECTSATREHGAAQDSTIFIGA